MQSCKVMRQMPGQPGRAGRRHGEAGPDTASDETGGTLHEHPDTGSANLKVGTGGLLEGALTRQNLQVAWKRVKANKGAAGVDGLDIEQTAQQLRTQWAEIRQALLAGRYRPQPVRKVMIPKPDGSQRELGILVDVNYPGRSATTILAGGRRGINLGWVIGCPVFEFLSINGYLASAARQAKGEKPGSGG